MEADAKEGLAGRPGSAEFVGYSSDLGGWCAYSQPSRGDYKVELGPFSTAEDAQQAMKSDDSTTRLLSDAVSYASDQSLAFRKCAGHHAEHNPGAEAVALRAAEILDRIIADLRSPNSGMNDGPSQYPVANTPPKAEESQ